MAGKSVGRRIADLRTDRDVLQGDLAAALGIHPSVLNRIEKGHRPIRDDELLGIARYFKVSADYLLGIEFSNAKEEICYTQSEREHMRKYRAIGKENEKHVDALVDSFYNALR